MRFLISAVTMLALANGLNAKLMTASVGPITENPVPSWGRPAIDNCRIVGSCDACQPQGAQYCYYKQSGDATCCVGVNSFIGVDDGHEASRNNNIDNDDEDDNATDHHHDDLDTQTGLVASVGPIVENPIPSWGQPSSDSCTSVGSCDSCQPFQLHTTAQYCYYKDNGDATCCQGDPRSTANTNVDTNNSNDNTNDTTIDNNNIGKDEEVDETEGGRASVGPIEEEPIPVWARPSDTCTRRRSCDVCQQPLTNIQVDMANIYCKYTETGVPMCCTGNRGSDITNANSNHEVDDTLLSVK